MEKLRGARRAHLMNIRTTDKAILGVYQRAAERLAREAAKAGSLTERWKKDYLQSVRETVDDMRRALLGEITNGARLSARLPAEATADWLGEAARRAGMDESFRAVMGGVPTQALRAILDGKMYSDGRTLSDRIWDKTGRLHYGIEEVVTQGIAQKQSALQIAKNLEAYVRPDAACPMDWKNLYPNLPFSFNVDYNATRLARTAINHAYWGAGKLAAQDNPLCMGMKWSLSNSHYERQVARFGQDVCDQYAAHDEGLGKGVYPIDKLPMPHPQCLCTQTQAVPSMEDAVARLNHWLDGGHDPALAQGFGAWKRENVEVDKRRGSGTIEPGDILVPSSLGARATIYEAYDYVNDVKRRFVPRTSIKPIVDSHTNDKGAFAGRGTDDIIREEVLGFLCKLYEAKPEEWSHNKGIGTLFYDDEEEVKRKAEVHWFELPDGFRARFRIVKWGERVK